MTYYFGFALAEDHQSQLDALLDKHGRGEYSEAAEISRLAIMGVDGVVHALAINVIALLRDENGDGTALLDKVAKLVLKTMHGLLGQLLASVSQEEQDKLAEYMLRRRVQLPEKRLFGYFLSDADGQRFQQELSAVAEQKQINRDELAKLLMHFIDLTTLSCYDEFIDCLTLSFMKRQGASLARTTIIKAGHATIRALVKSLNDEQVVAVASYYRGMFHQVVTDM